MAAEGASREPRQQYVGVAADGSPAASPKHAHALRPQSPTASDEFSTAPLSLSRSGPLQKPWTRLGKVALIMAVPAILLLVAVAGLLVATGRAGSASILFGAAPDYDVLVIGAGTAGLAAARQLRMQGGLKVHASTVRRCHHVFACARDCFR